MIKDYIEFQIWFGKGSKYVPTSQRNFSPFFESIGIGIENFGLEKSLGIGLENIWSQKKSRSRKFWSRNKSLGIGLDEFLVSSLSVSDENVSD